MAEVCYLSRGQGGHNDRWIRTLEEAGHKVRAMTEQSPEALRSTAAEHRIDLVVAGPLTDATVTAVEADVAPVLALCWGFDLLVEMGTEEMERRVSSAIRRVAGIHVDCNYLAAEVIRLGARRDTVTVGAWGIDTELFTPGAPTRDVRGLAGWGADETVVLTSRTWAPLYHVDVVLGGFARAHSENSSLRLAWAGDGPQAEELRNLVQDLGITGAVHELGRLDPVLLRDWLRSSDLYVSGSTSDGSSLSLMEALATGLPAVVTDLPSNREWVLDDRFGALFPTGSEDGLAQAISSTLQHGATEARRRRRRDLVLDKGDWRKNRLIFLDAVERCIR
jgi:L-malate glycosyltransferase